MFLQFAFKLARIVTLRPPMRSYVMVASLRRNAFAKPSSTDWPPAARGPRRPVSARNSRNMGTSGVFAASNLADPDGRREQDGRLKRLFETPVRIAAGCLRETRVRSFL